jgi:hypothetical protein
MIAKFARYPRDLDFWTRENSIYDKLKHLPIAPRFFGYITETNSDTGPRPIGYLLSKLPGRHATSLADFPLCRTALTTFHQATGCMHGDPNCYNFLIKPDGSGTWIYDFERAKEADKETMRWEIENFERNMMADEERKRELGEGGWREQCLREQLEVMAPLTEVEEERMDELGEEAWVEERVRERLTEEDF